ncbi:MULTISPECIES: TerC family protein [unclassified Brevibacterium]|jgi:tellurite resistance protein TerC|uniref:TerC family protein n=1 Tax=unclassified Brevibacterium TaxID=2614124 RepID=UPI00108217D7|nr:TerC family protein [Brevibacterium sp. S111]TGD10172.1 TerC family protein [Brevibacterium sp. S111]
MTTELPFWFETGSLIVLVLILVADLLLVIKRPHIPSMREATLWVSFYVSLALLFAVAMYFFADGEHAGQFLAGWLTEYSLSIDNLFVFVIIMTRFKVPRQYQQEVLMVGIIIALVFRGVFILAGSVVINLFISVFYLFGVFLLWTAWNQAFGSEDESDEDNRFVRWLKGRVNISDDFDGNRLKTTIDGQKFFTPMLLVFIAIGTTDVMFALDSIPAIFGITQSPFIVFTANLFALMGLRQLYFLLGGLLDRLIYLKYGIAAILAFIGVKLILHAAHENNLPFINGGEKLEWVPDITTGVSLAVIIGCMAVATIASLIAMKRGHQEVHFGQVEHEQHHVDDPQAPDSAGRDGSDRLGDGEGRAQKKPGTAQEPNSE